MNQFKMINEYVDWKISTKVGQKKDRRFCRNFVLCALIFGKA